MRNAPADEEGPLLMRRAPADEEVQAASSGSNGPRCSWWQRGTAVRGGGEGLVLTDGGFRLLVMQVKEDQLRLEEDEASAKERLKDMREHSKKWEETRETRV